MFWGTFFSIAAAISAVYYSYKKVAPDLIEISGLIREKEPVVEQKIWWKESIFYRVDLRNYQDSDGDGLGDVGGLIERLPYVSELGVDAIWLSPFVPEDKDFEDLRKACAQRKIKIVLDLPGNATLKVKEAKKWIDWFWATESLFENYINASCEMEQDWIGYSIRPQKSPEKARLAAMLLLTLKGTPILNYGEEIGMTEDEPMRWEPGLFSGFSTGQPWKANSEETLSVAEHKEDYNDSRYWFYRKLIYFRQENLSLQLGNQVIEKYHHPHVLIYSRTYEQKTLWIALNMAERIVELKHHSEPKVLFSTHLNKSDGFTIKAFEGIVWSYE